MTYAVACSEAASTPAAAAATAGTLMEAFEGRSPTLVVFFATSSHLGDMDTLGAVLGERLVPDVLVGVGAVSVIGGSRELEEVPAVVAWATDIDAPTPVRFGPALTREHSPVTDLPAFDKRRRRTLVLLADPFSFPADRLLREIDATCPHLRVIGGLASAGNSAGENRFFLGGDVFDDGAVGLLFPPAGPVTTVVSQGCRPIGHPYIVTRRERNVIHELAGRPALERLQEIIGGLDSADRALVQRGLHIGIVVNEHKLDFDRGDFLVRGVLGIDRESRGLAVGDMVETGTSVQFQVRDAVTADEDLRDLMSGHAAEGALLFTCNGRGRHLFGVDDHDASVVSEAIAPAPVAGMFCAGEFGPVGRRSFVHGFTASVALFDGGTSR